RRRDIAPEEKKALPMAEVAGRLCWQRWRVVLPSSARTSSGPALTLYLGRGLTNPAAARRIPRHDGGGAADRGLSGLNMARLPERPPPAKPAPAVGSGQIEERTSMMKPRGNIFQAAPEAVKAMIE